MNRTIAIIARLIDRHQVHSDFIIRLRLNNREFTLAALYEFASKGYIPGQVSRGFNYEEIIPAAGYYLQGMLHQHSYDTLLTNKYDEETLNTLAEKDPLAVLISTTMIVTAASLLELFSSIRKTMPDTKIIAGGVFIWKQYLLCRDHSRFR